MIHNEILNDLTRDLLSDRSSYGVYDHGESEKIKRLVSHINDNLEFFISGNHASIRYVWKIDEVHLYNN